MASGPPCILLGMVKVSFSSLLRKVNSRKKDFLLAYGLKAQSIMVEKTGLLAQEVAGPVIATIQKQGEMSTDAQLAIFFGILSGFLAYGMASCLWDGVSHIQGESSLIISSQAHPEAGRLDASRTSQVDSGN